MTLYDSISQKLGMDSIEYIEYHRAHPPKVETEDDNASNPLSILTLEEIELFEKYAIMTYFSDVKRAPREI